VAKLQVTALRALLRFLYLEGESPALADAVPTVAGWRGAALAHSLEPTQVARLLASCDRRTGVGRRDHAMLTLLVRLGLRAGEVAALTLDDVDWRRARSSSRAREIAGSGSPFRLTWVRRSAPTSSTVVRRAAAGGCSCVSGRPSTSG